MKSIERIDSLYREFTLQHPRFADTQYVLPVSKVENLRQMALVNRQVLALCNAGRNDYIFINECCEDFDNIFAGQKTVQELFEAMHTDDLSHFVKAWEIAFGFMQKINTEELMNYSLILECRLLDNQKTYRRVMFKYLMILEDEGKRRGQVLLILKPIDGIKTEEISRGIYIIDIKKRQFIYAEKGFEISKRELEISQLSQKGLTSDEIANTLGIKLQTVNNHRYNISQKVSVQNILFAVTYLRHMGVI